MLEIINNMKKTVGNSHVLLINDTFALMAFTHTPVSSIGSLVDADQNDTDHSRESCHFPLS